jgi:hypothetical protein
MKRLILGILTSLTLIMAPATPLLATASADCGTPSDSKSQVLQGIGETNNSDCSGSGVTDLIRSIINILSIIVGIAAVIVIIISGLKYITSSGDSGKVSSAKNTLIYALIGLVIAALAQFLVHFVLTASGNSVSCSGNTHLASDGQTCIKG